MIDRRPPGGVTFSRAGVEPQSECRDFTPESEHIMTTIIDGNDIADRIRDDVSTCVDTLADAGVTPGLATVLMSEDPASDTYVSMKQRACEELGIEGYHHEIDPDEPAEVLYERIDELNADPSVHGILVQMPVPDHVEKRTVLESVDPVKDVDGFHPENVGRPVRGTPRFRPCTPHGIQQPLDSEIGRAHV